LLVLGCDQADLARDGVSARMASLASTPQKLSASDGSGIALFGRSVSLDGDTAVVGAVDAQAAYIYARNGTTWTEQQKLVGAGVLGSSVSIVGDTALIGELGSTAIGPSAVIVFVRSGAQWMQQQVLSDGVDNDSFGTPVALSADTALIGAFGRETAYVYTKAGTAWTQQQVLTASDGATGGHYFGSAVSLSGDTVLIGASGHDAAYVFVRTGATWTEQQKLAVPGGSFGSAVALSGDTALVADPAAESFIGAVYVYTRSGAVWTQQQKLTASDGAGDDSFGGSVSVLANIAVVGAAHDNGNPSGSAYVFARSGTTWSQTGKWKVSDGAVDEFGGAVSLSGSSALVGAGFDDSGKGAAYVFNLPEMAPPEVGASDASDAGGDATTERADATTERADALAPRPASGCSCETAAPSGHTHPWAVVLLGMLLMTRRRRGLSRTGPARPCRA
jgi:MYXO-CTERM domain-containing protein